MYSEQYFRFQFNSFLERDLIFDMLEHSNAKTPRENLLRIWELKHKKVEEIKQRSGIFVEDFEKERMVTKIDIKHESDNSKQLLEKIKQTLLLD